MTTEIIILISVVCTLILATITLSYKAGSWTQKIQGNRAEIGRNQAAYQAEIERQQVEYRRYQDDVQLKFQQFLDQNRQDHRLIFERLETLADVVRNGGKS